jgi:site-specific recombinase XerD
MKTTASMENQAMEFLEYRRLLGFQPNMRYNSVLYFGRYMDEQAQGQAVTEDWLVRWSKAGVALPEKRLSRIRTFVSWLGARNPSMTVPDSLFEHCRAQRRQVPYIYAPEEVAALMSVARQRCEHLKRRRSKHHPHDVMLGTLYAAGLRPSEAVRLDDDDVDWAIGALRIRQSKNRPVRLVAMHATAVEALARCMEKRNRNHPKRTDSALFLSEKGIRISWGGFYSFFKKVRREAGVPFRPHWRSPRLHDFRHTFACNFLMRRYREGRDMSTAIADLSTYLGHIVVADTYWYLECVPELMALCGKRFREHVDKRRREGQS